MNQSIEYGSYDASVHRAPVRSLSQWLADATPRWLLRLRLDTTRAAIARLETQLSDDFGLLETTPIHRELADLSAERDALETRLFRSGWATTSSRAGSA